MLNSLNSYKTFNNYEVTIIIKEKKKNKNK